MPARIATRIQLDQPDQVRFRHLWGLACALVDTPDRHGNLTKPFSVRPLAVPTDGVAVYELGILADDVVTATNRTLEQRWRRNQPIRLGRHEATMTHPPHVTQVGWSQLWDGRSDAPRLTLRFTSPLVFLHGKHGQSPWPFLPSLVRGWARRWAAFAPEPLTAPVATAVDANGASADLATVAHFDGHAAQVQHGERAGRRYVDRQYLGYLGTVTYDLQRIPSDHRRIIHALASLSPYSGSGGRTTIGLGATEYTPSTAP